MFDHLIEGDDVEMQTSKRVKARCAAVGDEAECSNGINSVWVDVDARCLEAERPCLGEKLSRSAPDVKERPACCCAEEVLARQRFSEEGCSEAGISVCFGGCGSAVVRLVEGTKFGIRPKWIHEVVVAAVTLDDVDHVRASEAVINHLR